MPHNLPPGVTRDPETGKFQRGNRPDMETWHDTHGFIFSLDSTIPAADLAGETSETVENSNELITTDFSEHLEVDEVFEASYMAYTATLSAPTTATAEGHVWASWTIQRDTAALVGTPRTTFLSTLSGTDVGIADVSNRFDVHEDSVLDHASLVCAAGLSDTTNSLAAGETATHMAREIPYRALFGTGPFFDQDDEIAIPHGFDVDNVSDHAVNLHINGVLRGPIHELD